MAYRNGKPVGRIAAIINHRHNEFHKDKAGFFGFFEAVNDIEVFEALLKTAEEWLIERGCNCIIGPMNPTINDEVGFLIDGFDSPPFFNMIHTPPYYKEKIETLKYVKAKDLYAYHLNKENFHKSDKIDRICKIIQKKYPVKVRIANIKKFDQELEAVKDIFNDAWEPNWGFIGMTSEEIDYMVDDFKKVIDPELALFGEYNGEVAGFLFALPNYNEVFKKIPNGRLFPFGFLTFLREKKKIRTMRVIILGIKRKYQKLGIGALLYQKIIENGLAHGMREAEQSWILEDNDLMNKSVKLFGARIYKTYRVYQKTLA